MKKEGEELMELSHEPVPGYKKAFYIIMIIAIIYIAVILFNTI